MKVKELIKKLGDLDPEGMIAIFTDGEFHLIGVKEHGCNCGDGSKVYYLTKKEENGNQEKEFIV